jgi:hypothetical protein
VRPGASRSGGWQSDANQCATHFGPFSPGTESVWCRNSPSLGKRVSRQSVGCGPGESGRSRAAVATLRSQSSWHNHVKERRMRVISTRTHGAIDYLTGIKTVELTAG